MSGACKFCGGAELRPDLIAVGEMPGGRLYLHRDQTHPGRLLLASRRHVKKITDLTPEEYAALMDSVYQAAQALTSTNKSISDICYMTGFNNTSYFTKKFREQYGMTPKAYRAQNQTK